ncbi:homeotic protein proboscipedia-like [Penaeus chinensis]|uniref:homeotic protein proboscipedia-like n=1 Tax=Penaeus chinensis TaxID=139456 RepID=UPI001FB7F1C1|nr:homeotic protein proboscipedia-like [Penaeus chinensis]
MPSPFSSKPEYIFDDEEKFKEKTISSRKYITKFILYLKFMTSNLYIVGHLTTNTNRLLHMYHQVSPPNGNTPTVKVWFQNRRMKHKRQAMTKSDDPDKKAGGGRHRADDATNNNTKSAPSSPDSMCSSDVKKEESNDSLPLGGGAGGSGAGGPLPSVGPGAPGGGGPPGSGLAPLAALDTTKVKCEDSEGVRYPGPAAFGGEGVGLKDGPGGGAQDTAPLNTPPIPRATPPLTPATPTPSPAHLAGGARGVPGSPALTTPPITSSRGGPPPAPTTTAVSASAAAGAASTTNTLPSHGFAVNSGGRGAARSASFSYCGAEGKGRGMAGSYPGAYRGAWVDQYRGMGRATPPQFMANANSRASGTHAYDYTCAQQHQQQQQQQQRGQHMYNGGYGMDGYSYNRHYYNNNMMCADGYSSYNYMYGSGGMYACQGDASGHQYYDSYGMTGATGYEHADKGSGMASMTANNPANMANMASMNNMSQGGGGGYYGGGGANGASADGVAYQEQQYANHQQTHEHDLNFTFNFFEQGGGGGGGGGGANGAAGGAGGGTGGSTAPSENSNSSDFNFLSNLANDFAPEYYQLS